jgi:hypothetical protein
MEMIDDVSALPTQHLVGDVCEYVRNGQCRPQETALGEIILTALHFQSPQSIGSLGVCP